MIENLNISSKLLEDFSNFIDKRSIVFLTILDEVFPKILEWHFSIWQKEYQLLKREEDLNEWSSYSQISRTMDTILKKIEERALNEGGGFSFFRIFSKHVEKYKKELVKHGDKEYYYVESVIPIFYSTLIKNIKDSPERNDIWEHYFPSEWKVTKNTVEKKENTVTRVLLNNFLQWAQERFWKSEEKNQFDEILDEMASNLFPSVDPSLWARLLTLLMRPWSNENRMKPLIEEGINFGLVSRPFGGIINSEEEFMSNWHNLRNTQEQETLELVLFLFSRHLTKDILIKFIGELKTLEYDEGSKYDIQRNEYIAIFKRLITLQL